MSLVLILFSDCPPPLPSLYPYLQIFQTPQTGINQAGVFSSPILPEPGSGSSQPRVVCGMGLGVTVWAIGTYASALQLKYCNGTSQSRVCGPPEKLELLFYPGSNDPIVFVAPSWTNTFDNSITFQTKSGVTSLQFGSNKSVNSPWLSLGAGLVGISDFEGSGNILTGYSFSYLGGSFWWPPYEEQNRTTSGESVLTCPIMTNGSTNYTQMDGKGWAYMGCFKDSYSSPSLDYWKKNDPHETLSYQNNGAVSCSKLALESGQTIFGLQNCQGNKCDCYAGDYPTSYHQYGCTNTSSCMGVLQNSVWIYPAGAVMEFALCALFNPGGIVLDQTTSVTDVVGCISWCKTRTNQTVQAQLRGGFFATDVSPKTCYCQGNGSTLSQATTDSNLTSELSISGVGFSREGPVQCGVLSSSSLLDVATNPISTTFGVCNGMDFNMGSEYESLHSVTSTTSQQDAFACMMYCSTYTNSFGPSFGGNFFEGVCVCKGELGVGANEYGTPLYDNFVQADPLVFYKGCIPCYGVLSCPYGSNQVKYLY